MTGNDSEFAAWLGVNKSTVSRARKAGRLVLDAEGRVDFEASAAKWHETAGGRTDVAARHAAQRGAAIPTHQATQKNATMPDSASGTVIDDGESSRRDAKVVLLHYENAQIKLDMAVRSGQSLRRPAAMREAGGLGATVRAGIERVIDHTAPRLAASGSEAQRRQILDIEIRRLRWIIKRELPRALRRMREDGRSRGNDA